MLKRALPWSVGLCFFTVVAAEPSRLTCAGRELFLKGRPGVRVNGWAFYTRPEGTEMMRCAGEQTASDKTDVRFESFSADNGRTWSPQQRIETNRRVEGGTERRSRMPGWPDPDRGILLTFIMQAVLPSDKPLEGMQHWTLRYALSRDGGRSFYYEAPVVQPGPEYSERHPLPGVWTGRNAAMIGDTTCVPIRLRTGEILQPVQITPLGPDGKYFNPGGGYTYHDAAVLIGKWIDPAMTRPDGNVAGPILQWELSQLVKADPQRSTRGMLEPTLAEMPDGRVLMVMRGSNDRKPELPGYRWYAVSSDGARTWSQPRPWTYTGGEPFYSPSSCSQLLQHSSGRIYWIGNIAPGNPRGNAPRYPLVIGEVDPRSLLLIRKTICTLDDRAPGDAEYLAFSNFFAHEDRLTKEIVVYCAPVGQLRQATTKPSRRGADATAKTFDWTADTYAYRVKLAEIAD